jgi:L-rhamnose mutarotase
VGLRIRRLCFVLDLAKDPELIRRCREWHAPAAASGAITAAIRRAGVENFEIHICGDRLFMIMDFRPAVSSRAALSSGPRDDWVSAWEGLFGGLQPPPPWAIPGERWALSEKIYVLRDGERDEVDCETQ